MLIWTSPVVPPRSRTPAPGPRPDRAFGFAPSPMLLFDASGTLVDVNAACRELMGLDIAGCKGRSSAHLAARLGAAIDGDLHLMTWEGPEMAPQTPQRSEAPRRSRGAPRYSDRLLGVAVSRCRYRSPRFGWTTLQVAEVPCVDTATGDCTGSLVTLDVLAIDDRDRFQACLERRWVDQVTWEVYAASYDRVLPELPFYREVVERHRAAMTPAPIETILDVGAGTGSVTVPLARQGKRVTAIDANRAMLERLSSKLQPPERPRVTLVEDTAERLPHAEDGSFDGVTALLAFFAMDDPMSALREAERTLRPGGTVIITEPKRCFDVALLMAEAERVLEDRGLMHRLHGDWVRIQSVAPRIKSTIDHVQGRAGGGEGRPRWDAETVLEILRGDGFRELRFEDSHLGNCATISGIKGATRRTPPRSGCLPS